MSRTYRRCTSRNARKPKPVSSLSVPELLTWLCGHRKTIMADDPWQRRYFQTGKIKRRSNRQRRTRERLLICSAEPELLVLPESHKRWFWSDTIF